MVCKNCSQTFDSEFCPRCGQAAGTDRFDGRYLFHSVLDWFDIDRGIFKAVKQLLTRPG